MTSAGELHRLAPDVETLAQRLGAVDYLVDEGLATSMFLSLRLPQPLLLEGEAGVGKTEAAKSLAAVLDTPLIRLQCYEGIDAAEALYEWNYPRQLLSIRLAEAGGETLREEDLFGPDYLIRRPLLRALEHPGPRPAVLLIDEIDRADDDFEAFLLELLAEARVTIPELGPVVATHPPIIVLTSNRTRDLHDAVKRRCLYHWIDYPNPQREVDIIRRRVKGSSETLAVQVADAVSRMRDSDVQKPPGIAEAIDWLAALERARDRAARCGGRGPHPRVGAEVRGGPGGDPRGRPRAARAAGDGASGSRRSSSIFRRSPERSAGACTTRACPCPPSGRPPSRARSRSSDRCRGGVCTGPPAACSSPTGRRFRRSTQCSSRSSGPAVRTSPSTRNRRTWPARRPASRPRSITPVARRRARRPTLGGAASERR